MLDAVEIVRSAGRAFDEHDWDALYEFFHPDAMVRTVAGGADPIDADEMVRRTADAAQTAAYSVSIDVIEAIDEHAVVSAGSVRSRPAGGGIRHQRVSWLNTLRDGLIFRSVVVASEQDARDLYAAEGVEAGIPGPPAPREPNE